MDIMQQLEEVEKKLGDTPPEQGSIVEEPAAPAPELVEESQPEQPKEAPKEDAGDDVVTEQPKEAAEDDEEEAQEPKQAKTSSDYVRERRMTKKDLEQQLIEAKAQVAAFQAMQEQARRAAEEKAKPAPTPAPDPNQDPDGYRDWVLAEQAKQLKETRERLEALQRTQTEQAARNELAEREKAFSKVTPDYDAVMDTAEQRLEQLVRMNNPHLSDLQVKQAVDNEKLGWAARAAATGRDPVEMLYNQFKALFGVNTPANPKPSVKSEAEKLESVAKNKKMAASGLSGASTAGSQPLSKEALLKMTPAEYAKLTDAQKSAFMQ